MTKTDLDVCLQCLTICIKNGLIAVESLVEVGTTAKKLKSAMEIMNDADYMAVCRPENEKMPDEIPAESNGE